MKIKNPRLILLNKLHNYHLFFWFNLLPQWRPDRCVPSADKLTWFKVSAAAALQTLLQVNTEYRARHLVPPPSSRNHFNSYLVVCAMWIRLLSDQLVLLTWENFLQVWTSWAMVRVVHDFIKLVKTRFLENFETFNTNFTSFLWLILNNPKLKMFKPPSSETLCTSTLRCRQQQTYWKVKEEKSN